MGTGAGIGNRIPYNRMNSDQLRGPGRASNEHGVDDTLDISSHQQSFDQNQDSIATKRLRTNNYVHDPNDIVNIQGNIKGPSMMMMHQQQQHFNLPDDKEGLDQHIYQAEFKELRQDMQEMNTGRSQDVMGEQMTGIRKVHTREMSRLFRSKREIYQTLLIDGQFYLPPIEDCTIDFLRDIMSGKKSVS